MEILILHRIPR